MEKDCEGLSKLLAMELWRKETRKGAVIAKHQSKIVRSLVDARASSRLKRQAEDANPHSLYLLVYRGLIAAMLLLLLSELDCRHTVYSPVVSGSQWVAL